MLCSTAAWRGDFAFAWLAVIPVCRMQDKVLAIPTIDQFSDRQHLACLYGMFNHSVTLDAAVAAVDVAKRRMRNRD